jgi:hypothetical protein
MRLVIVYLAFWFALVTITRERMPEPKRRDELGLLRGELDLLSNRSHRVHNSLLV